jgi:hypothetical protein
MSQSRTYRREPRGRPAIGFVVDAPCEVELRDGAIARCSETRPDGKRVGELEISVFAAPLIIDRDGLLAEKAIEALAGLGRFRDGVPAVAVRLPGAEGFRAAAVQGDQLPYLYVFALTADEVADGGILVTVRAAGPDWPAADHILRSLRILTRQGRVATCADADDGPLLPVVSPRRS